MNAGLRAKFKKEDPSVEPTACPGSVPVHSAKETHETIAEAEGTCRALAQLNS